MKSLNSKSLLILWWPPAIAKDQLWSLVPLYDVTIVVVDSCKCSWKKSAYYLWDKICKVGIEGRSAWIAPIHRDLFPSSGSVRENSKFSQMSCQRAALGILSLNRPWRAWEPNIAEVDCYLSGSSGVRRGQAELNTLSFSPSTSKVLLATSGVRIQCKWREIQQKHGPVLFKNINVMKNKDGPRNWPRIMKNKY